LFPWSHIVVDYFYECGPSDRNESHVGKLHSWKSSKIW